MSPTTFARNALRSLDSGVNPFWLLPDYCLYDILHQLLVEDIEAFLELSRSCSKLFLKCNAIFYKAATECYGSGNRRESYEVTTGSSGCTPINAMRRILTWYLRIVKDWETLLGRKEYQSATWSHSVTDIDQVSSFYKMIKEEAANSQGAGEPESETEFSAKLRLEVVIFFLFYEHRLSSLWNSTVFVGKEGVAVSMFSERVTKGNALPAPTLQDTSETVGSWTFERDAVKRRYLVPLFRVGLPNTDYLLRILVDCTSGSDTWGFCFLERSHNGMFRMGQDLLMRDLQLYASSFIQALQNLLDMEKDVVLNDCGGLWNKCSDLQSFQTDVDCTSDSSTDVDCTSDSSHCYIYLELANSP